MRPDLMPCALSLSRAVAALRTVSGLIFVVASASAQDRNCPAPERLEGNRWVWLNDRDATGSLERHLPWGVPVKTATASTERTPILAR